MIFFFVLFFDFSHFSHFYLFPFVTFYWIINFDDLTFRSIARNFSRRLCFRCAFHIAIVQCKINLQWKWNKKLKEQKKSGWIKTEWIARNIIKGEKNAERNPSWTKLMSLIHWFIFIALRHTTKQKSRKLRRKISIPNRTQIELGQFCYWIIVECFDGTTTKRRMKKILKTQSNECSNKRHVINEFYELNNIGKFWMVNSRGF